MTRDTLYQRVRDALRRLKIDKEQRVRTQTTRVTTPHWRRAHEIVHPQKDLSEWVHHQMTSDWDNVKRGRNKH